MPSTRPTRDLVLASTSRYRAELMDTFGLDYVAAAPDVDERALDHRFAGLGADGYVLELARAKARSVAATHPDALIIGGDQAAVPSRNRHAAHQPADANEHRTAEEMSDNAPSTGWSPIPALASSATRSTSTSSPCGLQPCGGHVALDFEPTTRRRTARGRRRPHARSGEDRRRIGSAALAHAAWDS